MSVRLRNEFSDEGEISDSEEMVESVSTSTRHEGGQLWSAMIQAESLESSFKSLPIDESNKLKMVERDTESFPAPKLNDFKLPKFKSKSKKPADVDDLFGDSGDTGVEEFGVRSTSMIRTQPEVRHPSQRVNFLNRKEQKRWKRFERNKNKQTSAEPSNFMPNRKRRIQEAESMESLNSVGTENSGSSSQAGFSRTKKKKNKHKVQENAVLRPEFSFDNLYKVSIPTGLTVEQTGERLAQELGEQDMTPIKFAVSEIGIEMALELFDTTIETEKNGGLLVKYGNRRRTPGGVFFKHLHESKQITDEVKKKIYEFSREYTANKKKASKSSLQ